MSEIEITAADRVAAQALWDLITDQGPIVGREGGKTIGHGLLNSFAKHRIQARNAALEEAAWAAHGAIFDLAMAKGPANPACDYSTAVTSALRTLTTTTTKGDE